MILAFEEIQAIHQRAISVGLHNRRDQMLFGVMVEYVATLDQRPDLSGQLLSDLFAMNEDVKLAGDVVPLQRWLQNAAYAMVARADYQKFFREFADKAARWGQPVPPAGAAATSRERVLFVSDLLPIGFVAGAARTGQSVARLVVPRIEGGAPVTLPASGNPMRYFGTGWLLGPRHIITNHHVIKARSDGEAEPQASDFEQQALGTEVQFDYDHENAITDKFTPVKLSAASSEFDYAIIELDRDLTRPPLPIWARPIVFNDEAQLPVNIVQHPAGQPKQIAIRNNLAAKVSGNDLAYYTDTSAGSSGSPVCNDSWQVIALHKAATMSMGKFTFQGKKTAWINIGTPIEKIVADLKDKHADLWTKIRAAIV